MMNWRGVAVGGVAAVLGLLACGGTVDLRGEEEAAGGEGPVTPGGGTTSSGGGTDAAGMDSGDGGVPPLVTGGSSAGGSAPAAGGEGGSPDRPSCLGELDCPWSWPGVAPLHSRGQAIVAFDGSLYWFGGSSLERDKPDDSGEETRNTAALRYDPATDQFVELAPMPQGLYVLTAHPLGDKIYVFGGYGVDGFNSAVQIYDPAEDTWSEGSAAPMERYIFSSQAVDGKVYILGGQGPKEGEPSEWDYKKQVDVFDPVTGWSSGTPLPEAVAGAASCVLDGRIYVFGGEISNGTSIYDVAQGTWSEGAPPPVERNGHACIQVDGALIVLGGRNDQGGSLDAVETYDPATDSWATLDDPMPLPAYWFGADALGSKIYVFGGDTLVAPPRHLNQIQVFDFAALP